MAHGVAGLWNPRKAATALNRKETQAAGQGLGLKLQAVEGPHARRLFNVAHGDSPGAPGRARRDTRSPVGDPRHEVVEFAAQNRLPAVYPASRLAAAGGLLVYTVDFHERWWPPPAERCNCAWPHRRGRTYFKLSTRVRNTGDAPRSRGPRPIRRSTCSGVNE